MKDAGHRACVEAALKFEKTDRTPVNNFAFYEQEFRERLHILLQEIFNPAIPFDQTEDEKRCAYCDFRGLCHR